MRQLLICCILLLLSLASCSHTDRKPVDYVNPFIGTGFHGHTYPGATVPYGAVQLSPDTRKGNWDACSGYHYSDSSIIGFSHTHLSGTGCIDLGDILFHPVSGEIKRRPSGYLFEPLAFSHKDETAAPGYYSVYLKEAGIKAELTATTYAGIHRYTYNKGLHRRLVIDMTHLLGEETIDSVYILQRSENEIAGMRRTQGWTPNQYVFFTAQFSGNFLSVEFVDNNAILDFGESDGTPVIAKVGLSIVSEDNARENLAHDVPDFDFDSIRRQAYEQWNTALSDITVEGSETDKAIFYTAQYHTKTVPNIVSDVNGQYRRHDGTIARLPAGEKRYSTFSLWDTYRAWNPLVALTNVQLTSDMIRSYLDIYDNTGELPVWPLSSGETYCMIGYHSVSVIADAWMRGTRDFDIEKAFEAMKKSSGINRNSSDYYVKNGFIPSDKRSQSVSTLLEYAYDDWCIAQVAKDLGREDDYREYARRAQSYINVFDGYTRFFRGKRLDGNWDTPFNPYAPGRAYTEATAWQYRFYVPHDMNGLIQLFGGKEAFAEQLDSLFLTKSEIDDELNDITGLIGQYAHGNEPSHHIAYLYNYAGQPWKTQEMTRRIAGEMYSATPEGIIGNEDCGQMSAWYIWSSLGMYPVCPGSNELLLTTPVFPKASIRLANGKILDIVSNNPAKNRYIDQVRLNGQVVEKNYISCEQLAEGGTLEFTLNDHPNQVRGVAEDAYPRSFTEGLKVSIPCIAQDLDMFTDKIEVALAVTTSDAVIYYTLDGSEPNESSTRYTNPFELTESLTIKAKAFKEGYTPGNTLSITATKAVFERPVPVAKGKEQGVNYRYYEGYFQSVNDIKETAFVESGTLKTPAIQTARQDDHFAFIFTGILQAPEKAVYDFRLRTDDGSVLYIDNKKVIDNDGSHSALPVSGRIALDKGYHSYKILYFEDYEGERFNWEWKKAADSKFTDIPEKYLFLY